MTLLALHGFTQTPEQWRRLLPEALCPWVAGHGPAEPPTHGFAGEIARLAGLAAELPAPRKLLGYSQGARLGLGLLVAAPDLFERACLIGLNPGLETGPERAERQNWERGLADKLVREGLDAFLEHWESLPVFASQADFARENLELHGAERTNFEPTGFEHELAEQRRARRVHRPEPLGRALVELGLGAMPNYWPDLSQISLPVDLVVGALDPKFVALAERAGALFPSSTLHKIEGAGHNPLLEARGAVQDLLVQLGYA
jgi:2-succinyl-6-hydroxy-2,4-cyclohexadiene-1-carboxylate synthase